MAYTRTYTIDAGPAGDTVKAAVATKLDGDLTTIFANLTSHEAMTTNAHGVGSGTVVGSATTETQTNKTLSAPTLTGTVTMSGATLAGGNSVNMTLTTPTLTGTIPASGATFSSPSITGGTATNMTLVTPTLGTPASGTLTNTTGYPGLAITAGKTITCTQDTALDEAVAMSSKAPKTDAIKGDGTAGRVERRIKWSILDGTNADTINVQSLNVWNGDALAVQDNLAKNTATGNWFLNATGANLTFTNAAISGDCIAVLASSIYSNTTTVPLIADCEQSADGIGTWFRSATTGANQDLTAIITAGLDVGLAITYMTSA